MGNFPQNLEVGTNECCRGFLHYDIADEIGMSGALSLDNLERPFAGSRTDQPFENYVSHVRTLLCSLRERFVRGPRCSCPPGCTQIPCQRVLPFFFVSWRLRGGSGVARGTNTVRPQPDSPCACRFPAARQ